MIEWPRDRLCNVFEINNSEMVQLLLVERSWNQWILSKKIFCIHQEIQKKEDVFGELTKITELADERQVGSQCETTWGL